MKQPNTRVDRLKQMLALEERRSALQNELDSLVQQLVHLRDALFDESAAPAPTPRPTAKPAPKPAAKPVSRPAAPAASGAASSGRRGGRKPILREKIMAALQSAGDRGIIVKELAQAIGINPVNVHSWFHSALKVPNSGIIKIRGGYYRLGKPGSEPAPSAAASKTAKRSKRKGMKRGQLTEGILSTLKQAGSSGVTVKELASKLDANYRNVFIWFATTGKKFPQVKKIGPATYSLAS